MGGQVIVLLTLMAVAGLISTFVLGQDANWDLQNYHFYNAWAFVHGRMGWDLAPAQLQTFHNPVLDLPFYGMIVAKWPPRLISFVMALPAGIGAFFLLRVLLLLFRDTAGAARWGAVGAAFAIGITASGPVSLLGSTMNEWQGAALVIVALWLVLRKLDARTLGWPSLAAAGLLCGAASGLKLTAATYAVALCLAIALRSPPRARAIRDALGFGLAVLAGVLLTLGPWMWSLYQRFGNPLYPYFNNVFRSPWWDPSPLLSRSFGPQTALEWLTFPFRLFGTTVSLVTEVPFRDWRLPVVYLTVMAFLLALAIERALRLRLVAEEPGPRAAWRVLLVFCGTGFVLWAAMHSFYRYLIPVELLSGAVMVYFLYRLTPLRLFPYASAAATLLVIPTVEYPDWWRIDHGASYFEVKAPELAPHAVVLLTGDSPMAYVLPFLSSNARFLGAKSNFNSPERNNRLEQEIATVIREQTGPLYSLSFPGGSGASVVAAHGLRKKIEGCELISTNFRTSPLELCPLERTPFAKPMSD